MAKILTDKEMSEIVCSAVHGDEIDCADAYQHFLEELGNLIADHFGGERGGVSYDDDIGYTCAFRVNECVPDDGGVFKKYDTDIIWKDGVECENASSEDAEGDDIVKILKDSGKFADAIEDIHSWHSDCDAGNDGECAIYDAIQGGKSDEEIVLIAYDIDTELVEKYLSSGSNMESHAKKVATTAWEASKGFTITKLPMLSIDEFVERYKPILNHFSEDEQTDLFETYGEELEFVVRQPNNKIWTLVDGDSGLVIEAGYHLVNRVNYFVTEIEWTDPNTEVRYCDELED